MGRGETEECGEGFATCKREQKLHTVCIMMIKIFIDSNEPTRLDLTNCRFFGSSDYF